MPINEFPRPNVLEIETLIGTKQQINPGQLLNRGRLYTTQDWIDPTKFMNALQGIVFKGEEYPKAMISLEKIKGKERIVYTLGDGNHRVGLACINGDLIDIEIVGEWKNDRKRFLFNVIKNKIFDYLNGPFSK